MWLILLRNAYGSYYGRSLTLNNKKAQGILFQFIKTGTECIVNDKISNGYFSWEQAGHIQSCGCCMAKMVIDFESPHTYLLTGESLRQVCGIHTTFFNINRGYGLFPLKKKLQIEVKFKHYQLGLEWVQQTGESC